MLLWGLLVKRFLYFFSPFFGVKMLDAWPFDQISKQQGIVKSDKKLKSVQVIAAIALSTPRQFVRDPDCLPILPSLADPPPRPLLPSALDQRTATY